MTTGEPVVALTTTESQDEAHQLAQGLVEARLAAGVQITSPITAVYRWKGKIWNEPEWQLWIKTATDKRDDLVKYLDEHHSSEVPELIFLPITDGSDAYLNWIIKETRGTTGATAATQPTLSTAVGRRAPACPPGLPLLDVGPLNIEGQLAKPIVAAAGQQLTLPARIPPTEPDRRLLTFQIDLMLPGVDMRQRSNAVAQSPVVRLTPDQERVSPVVQIPTGLPPGTYEIVGSATWPSPSLCGVTNPPDSTEVGHSRGVLGLLVIT
jgi:periplasmic divalent cation tolerance protein